MKKQLFALFILTGVSTLVGMDNLEQRLGNLNLEEQSLKQRLRHLQQSATTISNENLNSFIAECDRLRSDATCTCVQRIAYEAAQLKKRTLWQHTRPRH